MTPAPPFWRDTDQELQHRTRVLEALVEESLNRRVEQ